MDDGCGENLSLRVAQGAEKISIGPRGTTAFQDTTNSGEMRLTAESAKKSHEGRKENQAPHGGNFQLCRRVPYPELAALA